MEGIAGLLADMLQTILDNTKMTLQEARSMLSTMAWTVPLPPEYRETESIMTPDRHMEDQPSKYQSEHLSLKDLTSTQAPRSAPGLTKASNETDASTVDELSDRYENIVKQNKGMYIAKDVNDSTCIKLYTIPTGEISRFPHKCAIRCEAILDLGKRKVRDYAYHGTKGPNEALAILELKKIDIRYELNDKVICRDGINGTPDALAYRTDGSIECVAEIKYGETKQINKSTKSSAVQQLMYNKYMCRAKTSHLAYSSKDNPKVIIEQISNTLPSALEIAQKKDNHAKVVAHILGDKNLVDLFLNKKMGSKKSR